MPRHWNGKVERTFWDVLPWVVLGLIVFLVVSGLIVLLIERGLL